jgi:F-type H+-transporting ATPase subunit b
MSKRESGIAERLVLAEQREQDAKSELERYQNLSDELEHQRTVLFEQARVESELTRKSLIEDARTEIHSRRTDWLESLQREQKTLIDLIRQRASHQVIAASRSALSQLADSDLEQQTLTTFLKRMEQLSQTQSEALKTEAEKHDHAKVLTAFEISLPWQSRIQEVIAERFSLKQVSFVAAPDLICGIELHVGSCKIGWSMQEFLESLSDELQGLLTTET